MPSYYKKKKTIVKGGLKTLWRIQKQRGKICNIVAAKKLVLDRIWYNELKMIKVSEKTCHIF